MARKKPNLAPIADFVRVWGRPHQEAARSIVEHEQLLGCVEAVETGLRQRPVRSSVLIGDSGVGKTAAITSLGRRLSSRGWTIVEASASDLMSGQSFIGQIDMRLMELGRVFGECSTLLLVCPEIHELVFAGRHLQSPVGVLEMMLPHIEAGRIRLVGETSPAAWETAVRSVPRLREAVQAIRVRPADTETAIEVGRAWLSASGAVPMDDALLREAANLADQFPAGQEHPGRLQRLIEATRKRVSSRSSSNAPVTHADLIATVSERTGLPPALLDEREPLDLSEVRAYFADRVMGQPEAVDAVVDRIALIKSGLTDPTRPQGVFLFAGPTGTGKTELAKTLAQYLFGAADRMIRLDMSEFQDPASMDRLLGDKGIEVDPSSLVSRIRQQPFSVLLLDEFEKAAPAVWDVFLQLFDDGRLTGRDGLTADFRNAIVILTSNLGQGTPRASLGFGAVRVVSTGPSLTRALEEAFRPEFINRLDRVIEFRPLTRPVMRRVLELEIKRVFERRGLRRRGWAVEWDEAALDFLLERGFSPTLGARPLKRAVEQLFLTPLAAAIVEHSVPHGEQFLFVRRDKDALAVEFVDPSLSDAPVPYSPVEHEGEAALALEEIALHGRGTVAELEALAAEHDRISAIVTDASWTARKDGLLASMSSKDFWNRTGRFQVLGEAEYMDRIETGVSTADSLLRRLQNAAHAGTPARLLRRLAEQLYLVGEAVEEVSSGLLGAAFIMVRSAVDPGHQPRDAVRFASELKDMYLAWSERRRMRASLLEDGLGEDGEYRAIIAVAGFGALRILSGEQGHHVQENSDGEDRGRRARAVVTVVAQPAEPLSHDIEAARATALQVLKASSPKADRQVVRRYTYGSAPLVRDAVQGWRTGRLDLVLGGDFDLVT